MEDTHTEAQDIHTVLANLEPYGVLIDARLQQLETLPDTLPDGCRIFDLYSLKVLPDNLPKGICLRGLRSVRALPETLPRCSLHGLHSVVSLPDTLPKGICLHGLQSVTVLPGTLPKKAYLCNLYLVTTLPDTLPEGINLSDLHSLKAFPDTLPRDFILQNMCRLLPYRAARRGNILTIGCQKHTLDHWKENLEKIASGHQARDFIPAVQNLLKACK